MPVVRIAIALVFLMVLGGVAASRGRSAPAIDVSGHYKSNYDAVHLTQRGDRVTGSYVCCGGGTIEGRIFENRIIRYEWRQPGTSGHGVWTISQSTLEGTWGSGASESSGGRWDLARDQQIAQ